MLRDLAERARWLLDVRHRVQRIHDCRGVDGACVGCVLPADLDAVGDDEPPGGLLARVRDLLDAEHRQWVMHDTHGAGWSCSGCALLRDLEALDGASIDADTVSP